MQLKDIIEDTDSGIGRAFALFIQALILLSIVSFSVETVPELDRSIKHFLHYFEVVTVAIFTIEYLLRLIVADHKTRYIFSCWGVIDLFAILPFYLSTGLDLRSIKIVRMLRLFRMFKLVRYTKAIDRFRLAYIEIKEELIVFTVATGGLLYLAAVGIYYFENQVQPEQFGSIFHALWWAVATLTTVGYGDIVPVTVGGKIFTFVILMLGLGIVAGPTALFASALTKLMNDSKS